jgi:hypothetical protein
MSGSHSLDFYAGSTALAELQQHGLKQERFSIMLGASGGPKWFVLYGLDTYLAGEFFKDRQSPLSMVGSSVGSFRSACYAQRQPAKAINTLATRYIETTYRSKFVSPATVTASVRVIIDAMLGDDGIDAILNNPVFRPHFIVTRARGLAGSNNRLLQSAALLRSSRHNEQSRAELKRHYERIVFSPADTTLQISDPFDIPTQNVALSQSNTREALLASGSLPVIMQSIKDIPGAPAGTYLDGGIVDYHFDVGFSQGAETDRGLILYPHFSANLRAGWFDKKLSRGVDTSHYDRVLLLCPSAEFISKLPQGQIPDRSDFTNYDTQQRIQHWRTVTKLSEQLADEFAEFIEKPDWNRVRPISELTGVECRGV